MALATVKGRKETLTEPIVTVEDVEILTLTQDGQSIMINAMTVNDLARLDARLDRELARMELAKQTITELRRVLRLVSFGGDIR